MHIYLPEWNQEGELRVIHGKYERLMLEIIDDTIYPGGLANPSLSQDEDVDVRLLLHRCFLK